MANAVVFVGNSLKHEQCGQKLRRAAFKKERRKRKRQALAKLRDSELQQVDGTRDISDDDDEEEERKAEERQRQHQEWLQRERVAQEEFRLKMEREEAARKRQEEEERRIKEEWEEQQRKEQEERDLKRQEKLDREEAVQKMLDQAESQLESTGPWKNPEAPVDYGTEKDRANCPFFLKTGACRFGDRCSRVHVHPTSSTTLMIRGMFVTFSMEQSRRDDYDTDAGLEYSEDDVQQHFLEFYEDVLPEFRSAGKVVQFKVSCNFEPHLRGNVYVQYETEVQCTEAFMMFNGRWYAGRQLQCEFSPVTRWKTAICGLFDRKKCPKGKHCNFLHVYRNPSREFWEADRDMSTSHKHFGSFTGSYSERRDWSYRHHSYSPERPPWRRGGRRGRSREGRSRSRGRSCSREGRNRSGGRSRRSRERRSRSRGRQSHSRERRSHSREGRSSSKGRSRHSGGWRSRSQEGLSRSRGRRGRSRGRRSRSRGKRSCSRDREYRGLRGKRSGFKSRSPSWSRDGDGRNGPPKWQSPKAEKAEKNSLRSKTNSPKNLDKTDNPSKSSPTQQPKKHSKKSKKSKKKKSKKRRSISPSGESKGEGTMTPKGSISPTEPNLSQHHLQEHAGGEKGEADAPENLSPVSVSLAN